MIRWEDNNKREEEKEAQNDVNENDGVAGEEGIGDGIRVEERREDWS